MKFTHAIRAQLRGTGRCAMTGMLVGLLATQAFALSGPATSTTADEPDANPAQAIQLSSQSPADLPLISEDNSTTDAALPSEPAPADPVVASSHVPDSYDLMLEPANTNASSTSSTTAPKKHKIRGGMLAMGIAGAGLAGFGAYIFSLNANAKSTGLKDSVGTAFLAPGAAMAGLGFYFAFK